MRLTGLAVNITPSQTQTRPVSPKTERSPHPAGMRPLLSIKEASGDCGNTQGGPRTDLHGFIKESLIKPGPVRCVIPSTPSQQPTSDPAPERRGSTSLYLNGSQQTPVLVAAPPTHVTFPGPQDKQTLRLREGTKPGTTQWEWTGSGERVKKPKQKPHGPGQMETLVPALSLP